MIKLLGIELLHVVRATGTLRKCKNEVDLGKLVQMVPTQSYMRKLHFLTRVKLRELYLFICFVVSGVKVLLAFLPFFFSSMTLPFAMRRLCIYTKNLTLILMEIFLDLHVLTKRGS